MSEDRKLHEYDGIVELDNPLPKWWLWGFFLTIFFAIGYYAYYELGPGPTLTQELEVAMQALQEKKDGSSDQLLETEESLKEAFALADLQTGHDQYMQKCMACHGNELQGLIGPNLTDAYWIHGGGTRVGILEVIRKGVLDAGMPPWDSIMKRDEIYAVAAYILSKKGTNPAGARPPQGELNEQYLNPDW